MIRWAACVLVFSAYICSAASHATSIGIVEMKCPIGGEVFKAMRLNSLFVTGRNYLDGRPGRMGKISETWSDGRRSAVIVEEPIDPLPFPQCPGNGFVVYKESFSFIERWRLQKFVASPLYQAMTKVHTDHFLAAKLMQHLGASSAEVASILLTATWQARDDEQYRDYAYAALLAYSARLQRPYAKERDWVLDQMTAGELERRLSKFDDSRRRFLALTKIEDLRFGFLRDIVNLQLKFIEARDSRQHLAPK